jgi:glycosyltransferase involved in cell wall biosynthesis
MDAAPRATTRVVFYTESTSYGGAEVALRNLLAELDSSIDATVLAVDPAVGEWIAAERPGTPVLAAVRVGGKRAVGDVLRLRRQISGLGADVFHANLRTIGDAQYGLLAACAIRGLAVLAVEQLPYPAFSRLSNVLKRITSKRLAAHVAVGDTAAREVEQLARLEAGSIETIYNGVPDRGALPLPDRDGCVLGTLARLDRIKGIDVLLRALVELPAVRLRLVGEGPDRDELVALAAELNLADRVELRPWTDDPHAELAAIDIFVLPSRNEGFPLSIVEAMLAGRPVVATDVGSVAEAVVPETGVVVPKDDVPALRVAIARLVDDHALRARLGAAGRERALERFTAAKMARDFEALYARITARR